MVRNYIPLGAELVATAATWLDCYPGHDAEPRLRHFLAEIKGVSPQQISGIDEPAGVVPDTAQDRYHRSG
ncbi:hypothetical protein ACXPWS_15470 [Mycobacterium sp. BMJ-28]